MNRALVAFAAVAMTALAGCGTMGPMTAAALLALGDDDRRPAAGNQPPSARIVPVERQIGEVGFRYRLLVPESDPASVEISFGRGGPPFEAATPAATSSTTTARPTTPDGI